MRKSSIGIVLGTLAALQVTASFGAPAEKTPATEKKTAAAQDTERGPHGGQVVADGKSTFEVRIDPSEGRVEVFRLSPRKAPPPKSMAITLYTDTRTNQTIELKAAEPTARFPRFEGQLGPNAGSVVGFEVKFGLSADAFKALPYIPYIPMRDSR